MNQLSTRRTIAAIAAQMEAAAGLIKFAADDLEDISAFNRSIFQKEMHLLVETMRAHVSSLEGNVSFLLRSDLFDAAEDAGCDGSSQIWDATETRVQR